MYSSQPSLFDRRGTIEERFNRFHRDNPYVYSNLCRLARDYRGRYRLRRFGIGMLFEVLRWEVSMQTSDPNFKLNNDFRAHYARLIARQEPDLRDAFELRERREGAA
jgi:hypothetical protein